VHLTASGESQVKKEFNDMNETGSEQGMLESGKELSVATATSVEFQITQEEFSKLTYRQRFVVTEYSYLLSPEDAEEVGKMLGNMASEKDILSYCQANGKKVSSFDTQEQDKAFAVTISKKTTKIGDFAKGFFGCLIIWNLIGPIALYSLAVVVILEFIGLVLPFALGKKWIGFGAVSFVITNAIVISVLSGELIPFGLVIPFTVLFFIFT